MKSKHIKKETAKRLRGGFHTDLMELIEDGIDFYTEETFSRGHNSFFEDASVHAHRIAQKLGYDNEDDFKAATNIINDYFNSLKTE